MNCKDVKRNIYLYDELSNEEKAAVDKHIAGCDECSILFEQVQQQLAIVGRAATWVESPDDSSRLTHKIMSSVKTGVPRHRISFQRLNLTPARLVMTSLSLFLIVLFISEYREGWDYNQRQKAKYQTSTTTSGEGVILNSGSFVRGSRSKKKVSSFRSIYQCLRRCGFGVSSESCEGCETRLKKIVKTYEGT